jgi:glycerol uptake facilitator-like aquaporin
MLDIFFAELLGTFILLSIILLSVNNTDKSLAWLKIGLTLGVCILLINKISGGHMNPAVSAIFWYSGDINTNELGLYMIAQFIGAYLAWVVYKINK